MPASKARSRTSCARDTPCAAASISNRSRSPVVTANLISLDIKNQTGQVQGSPANGLIDRVMSKSGRWPELNKESPSLATMDKVGHVLDNPAIGPSAGD